MRHVFCVFQVSYDYDCHSDLIAVCADVETALRTANERTKATDRFGKPVPGQQVASFVLDGPGECTLLWQAEGWHDGWFIEAWKVRP